MLNPGKNVQELWQARHSSFPSLAPAVESLRTAFAASRKRAESPTQARGKKAK